MSASSLTPQETRLKNLVLISRLTIVFGLVAATIYIFLGAIYKYWYNHLVAGSFLLVVLVGFLVIKSSQYERLRIGVWHLIISSGLTAFILSAVQANAGAEIGSAFLTLVLVLVIQTAPPKEIIRGAFVSAFISVACSVLAFYSPIPQNSNDVVDQVIIWVARGSTLAFLALLFAKLQSLNLASKFLVTFLGVVAIISLTFNIVMTTMATQTMSNQIGQELQAIAETRSGLIGNLLSSQAENLKTLALDDSIQVAIQTANKTYLRDEATILNTLLALDQEWRTAVNNNGHSFLIDWQLSNGVAKDLQNYRNIYPSNIETFATDEKGALVGSNNLTSDYYQADEYWWQAAYNNGQGKTYISLPEYDKSIDALSILIAVPVYDEQRNEVIGILRTTLAVDKLFLAVQQAGSIGKTGEVDIIFPADPTMRLHNLNFEVADSELLSSIDQLGTQTFVRGTYQGVPSIYARATVKTIANIPEVNNLGWSAVVHQNLSEALEPLQRQVRTIGFFGTLMAGFATLFSLFISQRLAQPISSLTETTSEISHGNLSARAPVSSRDEIGQLAEAFNTMTAQLQETLVSLEERVAERTMELAASSQKLEQRAGQFEIIAQLARTITSIQDLEKLLPRIAQLISQQFGYYHVGLFLLDESRQYAVLSAANSQGGQRMLARKHRLGVGQTSIVGYVTATGNPRIALDTETDSVYFDNPDLPKTRSEMALPLSIGGSIIGALDVQSTEPNAFSEADIEVLSILADEVSVAIDNARLYADSQRVLADAQSAFQKFTLESWRKMVTKRKVVGYELSGIFIRPLEKPVEINGSTISVPIKLREQVIGSMNISLPAGRVWNQDEMEIAQALAERVGIASESAMLLEESQQRAEKEHMIGQISEKFIASTDISNILKTAVQEISQIMSGAEVAIQLEEAAE